MKKGFLFFVTIALTIVGLYFGWTNYNQDSGGAIEPPPVLALLAEQADAAKKMITARAAPSVLITEQDRGQLETLNSILTARNDNDTRMDSELKVLPEGAKELLRKRYDEFPPENHNERGTIIFLLGRNLNSEADYDFMHKVLSAPPCRSLQNCREDSGPSTPETAHDEMGADVTLNYAEIMALKGLERTLAKGEADPAYERALAEVQFATNSSVEKIAQVAHDIEAKYGRGRTRR